MAAKPTARLARNKAQKELTSAERSETRPVSDDNPYYRLAGEDADWAPLTRRTSNALRTEGFATPRAAARLSDAALLLVDGFGKKGLAELRDFMQQDGRLLDALRESVKQVEARKAEPQENNNPELAPALDTDRVLRFHADNYEQAQQKRIAAGEQIRAVLQGRDETWGVGGPAWIAFNMPAQPEPLKQPDADDVLDAIGRGATPGPVPILGRMYHRAYTEERELYKEMNVALKGHPCWPWLKAVKGIGPTLACKLLARLDPVKATTPSAFWMYCGLATVPGERYACTTCGLVRDWPAGYNVTGKHQALNSTKPCLGALAKVAGTEDGVRAAMPKPAKGQKAGYDQYAKKVMYLVGTGFLKVPGSRFEQVYRQERAKLDRERVGWPDGRKHLTALRKVEKLFLCYSPDTDILTQSGIKRLVDVQVGEMVATLNPLTLALEYHPVEAKQDFHYTGPMLHFEGQCYDYKVTPEHRMWVRKRGREQWEFMEAQRLLSGVSEQQEQQEVLVSVAAARGQSEALRQAEEMGVAQTTARRWIAGGRPWGVEHAGYDMKCDAAWEGVDDPSISDAWLEYFGWWIAEGHTYKNPNHPGGYAVGVTQKDVAVLERLAVLLREMGYRPSIYTHASTPQVVVSSKELFQRLSSFGKSWQKWIPEEVKALPTHRLRILFDAMLAGDGTKSPFGDYAHYSTVSERLAQDVVEVALKCGYAPTLSVVSRTAGRTMYRVALRTRTLTPRIMRPPVEVDSSGSVHCLTVKNHIIYTGRNGKFAWSGNCLLWVVWREAKGLPVTEPYAIAHMGHSPASKIDPWDMVG